MPEIWFPNLGIEIAHLDRVAFTVFGRNVYWYGIFIGLAVVLGVLMAMKEAKRTGQSPDMYVDFIIYALIFAIIGARLYYVIFSWDFYSAHPEKIFALREGGLAIYGGIIGGVAIINWGTRKGYTHYVTDPKSLPRELRTGLVDPDQQKSGGKITISSICLDPMAFHLAIVLVPSLCGYYLCQYLKTLIPAEIPAFCMALLFGFIVQGILKRTGAVKYIDRSTISRISGTSTDFLIISGVGSVKIALVVKYAVPLLVVCAAGFLITWIWFMAVGAKSSPYDWFERNMMVWGHATGVAATGVLLQRVVDPDLKSRGIEDSGISDLFNRPIIVGLQVIPPIVIAQMGMLGAGIVTWVIMGGVALMFVAAYLLKWWRPENPVKVYHPSDAADESLGVAAMQAEG